MKKWNPFPQKIFCVFVGLSFGFVVVLKLKKIYCVLRLVMMNSPHISNSAEKIAKNYLRVFSFDNLLGRASCTHPNYRLLRRRYCAFYFIGISLIMKSHEH